MQQNAGKVRNMLLLLTIVLQLMWNRNLLQCAALPRVHRAHQEEEEEHQQMDTLPWPALISTFPFLDMHSTHMWESPHNYWNRRLSARGLQVDGFEGTALR